VEDVKSLNELVEWAVNPVIYKKDPKTCLDEFFGKINIDAYNPKEYQKHITDYYENVLYKTKYKNELNLDMIPYRFHDALLAYADIKISEGNLKEAITYLEKSLIWNPESRKAHYLICKIYFSLNEFTKAFEYAIKGLDIEYSGTYISYYYSVLTVFYLKRKDYVRTDEYASSIYLLNNNDTATINYLENRGIKQVSPMAEKNENIMDALLKIVYDESIVAAERARYAQILLSYEIMPIFKYEDFYLTLDSGVKNAEIKESVIMNGNYLLVSLNGNKYLNIKDKKHLFEKLVISYFGKIAELNLYLNNFENDRLSYEKEPILEEIKIKYNGKLYYIALTSTNPKMSEFYLEMKANIIRLATLMIDGIPPINNLFKLPVINDDKN